MGEMEFVIPEGDVREIIEVIGDTPVDVSVAKTSQSEKPELIDAGQVPHGFEIIVNLEAGQCAPGDVITVSDPLFGQLGVTSFGAPIATAPWVCAENSGAWSCTYVVPATGAILPATIAWPAIIDGREHPENCSDVAIARANMSVAEATMDINTSFWAINVPETESDPEELGTVSVEKIVTSSLHWAMPSPLCARSRSHPRGP